MNIDDNFFVVFSWIAFGGIWFITSFVSVFAMVYADFKMAEVGKIDPVYWFKGRKWAQLNVMMYIFAAPVAFLAGIVALFEIMGCLKFVKEEKTTIKPKPKYAKRNPKR